MEISPPLLGLLDGEAGYGAPKSVWYGCWPRCCGGWCAQLCVGGGKVLLKEHGTQVHYRANCGLQLTLTKHAGRHQNLYSSTWTRLVRRDLPTMTFQLSLLYPTLTKLPLLHLVHLGFVQELLQNAVLVQSVGPLHQLGCCRTSSHGSFPSQLCRHT